MASVKNFSKKSRQEKENNIFNNPQNFETNKVNDNMIKDFESNKEKWRELCSYFRLN